CVPPHPPRSPPFPYTTLFRSPTGRQDLNREPVDYGPLRSRFKRESVGPPAGHAADHLLHRTPQERQAKGRAVGEEDDRRRGRLRSEEHTSQLQSLTHTPCRLL